MTFDAEAERQDRAAELDANTLDAIARMLQDPEWRVGMLEDINELVVGTGRSTETNLGEDGVPIHTWDRH